MEILTTESKGTRRTPRLFLQPLTVAVVCVVFISLVLIMGWMDLRSLDKTLVGYMENRGLAIIKNVNQVAESHFQRLLRGQQTGLYEGRGSPFADDGFSLQESLVVNLAELARQIDFEWQTRSLSIEQLRFLASEEAIWMLAFLDDRGIISFKSRSVPKDILGLAGPVIEGHEEIKINIFNRSAGHKWAGFIALRRESGRGTIILALDDEGLRYRGLKVSVQRAIEEVGQDPDMAYFMVTDGVGRILGQAGDLVDEYKKKIPKEVALKETKGVTSKIIVLGGRHLLDIASSIRLGAGVFGTVRLSLARDKAEQIIEKERVRLFISTVFLVVIGFLSMWFLYRNQTRHLANMREIERKLHQAERLSALGRLAAGVAHEIRNPLNAISMASQRLKRGNLDQLTRVMRDEIRRLNHIIEEFLTFSRGRKLAFRSHDLIELLKKMVLLISEEAEPKGVTIKTEWRDSPLMISMDIDKLKQAFFNIIKNGMESISSDGSVSIVVEPKDKQWVSVKISDTGAGLTFEEIEQIFDPDYTTKEKGLGLGLPLAHEIIRGHGGEIQVQSQPRSGTTVEIVLPRNNKAHSR